MLPTKLLRGPPGTVRRALLKTSTKIYRAELSSLEMFLLDFYSNPM